MPWAPFTLSKLTESKHIKVQVTEVLAEKRQNKCIHCSFKQLQFLWYRKILIESKSQTNPSAHFEWTNYIHTQHHKLIEKCQRSIIWVNIYFLPRKTIIWERTKFCFYYFQSLEKHKFKNEYQEKRFQLVTRFLYLFELWKFLLYVLLDRVHQIFFGQEQKLWSRFLDESLVYLLQ